MKPVATWFFAMGAIFAIGGMVWGIQMAASQDHTLSPAHGHLNLIGFVAMSVFGAYYAITPSAAATRLAILHFWVVTLTVVVLIPGIVLAIVGRSEVLGQAGSILAVATMAIFLFTILRHGVGEAKDEKAKSVRQQSELAE